MRKTYVQGSKRACEFLKLARYCPMTREQLAAELGWDYRTVKYWVADLLAEGLVVEVEPPEKDPPQRQIQAKLVALAPAWLGSEPSAPEPAPCPCFPGTCRGGQVVNGRLANGQRCKAA